MALSYNQPTDSTNIVPLKLDMYRRPKALYSSNENLIGQKYKDIVQNFGKAERVDWDLDITNGKYIM